VTDCLALMQLGLPTVSPVTVRIRAADWERLIPKLRGVETVYICQDNELSQAGLKGALQTARTLAEHKIDTRLVTLPLSETQISARQELTERFGLMASVGPKELAKLLAGRPAEEIQAAEALLATAKIDVNDYIAPGIPGRISNVCSPRPARPSNSACARCPRALKRRNATACSSRSWGRFPSSLRWNRPVC